jgi:hypothetical protein
VFRKRRKKEIMEMTRHTPTACTSCLMMKVLILHFPRRGGFQTRPYLMALSPPLRLRGGREGLAS